MQLEIPKGTIVIGPGSPRTTPQDFVAVVTYGCIGVYIPTVLELAILAAEAWNYLNYPCGAGHGRYDEWIRGENRNG